MADTTPLSPPSQPAAPNSLGRSLARLAPHWGWLVALGALYVICGTLALGSLLTATVASVIFVGMMMMMTGIAEVIAAFRTRGWGEFALWLALGLLYIAAGIIAFVNPLLAATTLTLMLGVALIVGGLIRIYLALKMREVSVWSWVLFSGIVTLALGAMILFRWPASSFYALGIFLATDLIFAGFGWIRIGTTVRRLTDGK